MSDCCAVDATNQSERRLLWTVLVLNAAMFAVEFTAGWIGDSSGLMADSLDMLADAAVYAVSLYAVGHSLAHRARAALLNGSLQLILGLGVLLDVIRRWWFGSTPEPLMMTSIGALALMVNVTCFAMLYRHRKGDINLRSSWICSRNDMLANLGVIAAALLVGWVGAAWPDWLIGAAIAILIVHSAVSIIRDALNTLRGEKDNDGSKKTATGHSCCSSSGCDAGDNTVKSRQ